MTGGFVESWSAIEVIVASPSRVALVTLRTGGSYDVRLDEDLLVDHDEGSVAAEIEEAVVLASTDYQVALTELLYRRARDRGVDPEALPPSPLTPRDMAFQEQKNELCEGAESSRGYVRIRLYGDGDVAVGITPGTIGRLDMPMDSLMSEINTTMATAVERYRRSVRELRRRVYG